MNNHIFCKLFVMTERHLNSELDFGNFHLDFTIIGVHQHSTTALKKGYTPENHIGFGCVSKITKLHTITDALGNPVIFKLTAG